MRAQLTTLCGCTRTMTVTKPAPPLILVPLRAPFLEAALAALDMPPGDVGSHRSRRFVLDPTKSTRDDRVFYYEEA